jgi:hemoglobin-like flavoprotein
MYGVPVIVFEPRRHSCGGTHIAQGECGVLTARDIEIVRDDWEKVELIADQAATLLYDRLFALDRNLRLLFPIDLADQKLKVIRMLGAAINGLSDPDVLLPILRALGTKHFELGVRDQDYDTLAEALIWTLRQGLGTAFDAEHEAAWTRVYSVLTTHMRVDVN